MGMKIYRFSGDHCDWTGTDGDPKTILGGKGAALVMMAQAGMNVPPGFTIPTTVCNQIADAKATGQDVAATQIFSTIMAGVSSHMAWLKDQFGYTPLVSVRSGAPVSMPGMMDTILNVGLTIDNFDEWAARIGKRAAADSMRRLVQMLGSTAYGVPHEVFEFQLAKAKKAAGVTEDADLTELQLEQLVDAYCKAFEENQGVPFPLNDADTQLRAAIRAVFDSWMNPRAIEYRKLNGISQDMGTAVNVQAMVFGNMGDDSGTGVLFTRDPSTGEKLIMGEFLQNAQGEDVVAGIRTPRPLNEMAEIDATWAGISMQIAVLCDKLEAAYRDMVDVEFTVQQGELFILQSRVGKRSARAAFKIAVDMVNEGMIDRKTAFKRLTPAQFKIVRRPSLDPTFKTPPHLVGLPACPGVVSGKPVFSSQDAVNSTEPCILVTHETTPDDIAGMNAAMGILTQTGGATSHAAVVARAMDKACVVGTTTLDMAAVKKCSKVTIDGSTGNVWFDIDVPVIDSSDAPELTTIRRWAIEEIGMPELVPFYDVEDGSRKHVIDSTVWWGSKDVADAIMAEMVASVVPVGGLLATRDVRDYLAPEDLALADCFGKLESPFKDWLDKRAIQNGLATAGAYDLDTATPADYAVFTLLAHN